MARRTPVGTAAILLAVMLVLVAAMQTPFAFLAFAVAMLVVVAAGALLAARSLAALRRGGSAWRRVATPLGIALAALAGVAAGGLTHRARIAWARRDAERFLPLLEAVREATGRYPLGLDELRDRPPLPDFAAAGFYAASERRDAFTLRLTRCTWLGIVTRTDWCVYDSRTGRWASTD